MIENIKASLEDARDALAGLLANEATLLNIESAAEILIEAFENERRVFSCGNGGSMCDAMHFAEELTGRYRRNRKAYPAIAISDPSHLSCVAISDMIGCFLVISRVTVRKVTALSQLVPVGIVQRY